jgi:ribose-phosphate pyrophosphokinase
MNIIPCSNSTELGKNLAKELNAELAQYETRKFPDSEIYFRVDSDLDKAVIVQSGYPEPNNSLIEVLLAIDAAKEKGAKDIVLVFPYLPYARQDKRFKPGEALSLEVVSKALQSSGVSKLITVDAHNMRDYGEYDLFGLKAYNMSAGGLLAKHVKEKFSLNDLFIISPDFGASKMIELAAKESSSEFTALEKKRSGDFEVEMKGKLNVTGKNVLVLDDIISTGRTLKKAVEMAKEAKAEKAFAAAIHGIFSADSMKALEGVADYLVTTDSIQNSTSKVSLAGEIAKVL